MPSLKFQYLATPSNPIINIEITESDSYYFNKIKFTTDDPTYPDLEMFEMDTEMYYVLPNDEDFEEIKIETNSFYKVLKDKPWVLYYKDCVILEFDSVGYTWDQETVKVVS